MATILVVDDDPTNSDLLKMFLELEGFNVLVAHSLDTARVTLSQPIDLILLDYLLARRMNGLILMDEIRSGQSEQAAHIPIIVASGADEIEQTAIEQGANGFMHKPFSTSDLVAKIHELL